MDREFLKGLAYAAVPVLVAELFQTARWHADNRREAMERERTKGTIWERGAT